jgi:hypothetical protein
MTLFAKTLLLVIVTPAPSADKIPPAAAGAEGDDDDAELYAILLVEMFSVPSRTATPPPQAKDVLELTALLTTELDCIFRLLPTPAL